jgi:hypothetical protein
MVGLASSSNMSHRTMSKKKRKKRKSVERRMRVIFQGEEVSVRKGCEKRKDDHERICALVSLHRFQQLVLIEYIVIQAEVCQSQ